jgi:hypothetical protein
LSLDATWGIGAYFRTRQKENSQRQRRQQKTAIGSSSTFRVNKVGEEKISREKEALLQSIGLDIDRVHDQKIKVGWGHNADAALFRLYLYCWPSTGLDSFNLLIRLRLERADKLLPETWNWSVTAFPLRRRFFPRLG